MRYIDVVVLLVVHDDTGLVCGMKAWTMERCERRDTG